MVETHTNVINFYRLDINPNEVDYYIIGRTNAGGRYYSENMCYEDAIASMPKYAGMVQYFGGGTVELVRGETILKHKIVD